MKRPTVASLKKVTAENLAGLGAERLAEILVGVANTRPELKRRLRMELAAAQGAEHLALEIDKRLGSLETSRSKVSWRQRATFIRDLDALRDLIASRLGPLDRDAALSRMWLFVDVASRVNLRVRDRDGSMAAVFDRAASDVGALLRETEATAAAEALASAVARHPAGWAGWLPRVLEGAPPDLAQAALRSLSARQGATAAWLPLIRALADAADDADAYRSTFTAEALRTPSVAAEVAERLLRADRVEEAGQVLEAAAAKPGRGWTGARSRPAEPDYDWETAWIEYLDRSGQGEVAQQARWASFERTLSAERAKAFTRRLSGFDDVEAEGRAFERAAAHEDFQRGLQFLMDWPALPEAARMIQDRAEEIRVEDELAQLWAAKLRIRHPAAAHLLLRKAAAAAFRRRDFATCDRLTQEADSIVLP
ncbi:DUF6880 family protein [Phenylobacterium sp.]|uniref:DUF6880 family protein n=1 Tax=Phenylobacterium sp. TaxID=1871053 RepID=UPI002C1496E7|nr:DUF6880 family protein [Phenylobacterium sp.]HVI33892.1 hypothetical protein [Phenylobacterium sp.]